MENQRKKVRKTPRRKSAKPISTKGKELLRIISWVAEVFAYLVIHLMLAGLLVYEVTAYILYKIN